VGIWCSSVTLLHEDSIGFFSTHFWSKRVQIIQRKQLRPPSRRIIIDRTDTVFCPEIHTYLDSTKTVFFVDVYIQKNFWVGNVPPLFDTILDLLTSWAWLCITISVCLLLLYFLEVKYCCNRRFLYIIINLSLYITPI
jgi:hypothetical protein